MSIGFLTLVPIIFWLFIMMLVVAVAKPSRRPTQTGRTNQRYSASTTGRVTPRRNTELSFDRPKMQEGLFEVKLPKSSAKKKDGGFFSNTGYDDYSTIGRKKDYVSGYDKKYAKGSVWARQSTAKQYSHTYDGHEPWDKCLPKEKDPWDKDFYT